MKIKKRHRYRMYAVLFGIVTTVLLIAQGISESITVKALIAAALILILIANLILLPDK